jgi:hypothetical protein
MAVPAAQARGRFVNTERLLPIFGLQGAMAAFTFCQRRLRVYCVEKVAFLNFRKISGTLLHCQDSDRRL